MRALITASFDPAAKRRLEGHMDVVHEDWKARNHIYFDGAALAKRINDVGADVLIVEADLVHSEVLDGCRLAMIGCCRGEPVNVDLGLATEKGVPVFHTPGRNADAVVPQNERNLTDAAVAIGHRSPVAHSRGRRANRCNGIARGSGGDRHGAGIAQGAAVCIVRQGSGASTRKSVA